MPDESARENFKILFVDDEKQILSSVEKFLGKQGYQITTVQDPRKAMEFVKEMDFDVVFSDLRMPEIDGLELCEAIKEYRPETEVIIVTAYGTIESAVEAMRLESYDYLQKPLKLDRLKVIIDRIIEKKTLREENLYLKRSLKEKHGYKGLVRRSPRMQEICEIIERISLKSPNVLIQGESGTGKELAAKVIHEKSDRKDKPFIPVNCGAIVEGLLESELFGHVKGSFTGAVSDKVGLFRVADGGTLFLDEIAEIPKTSQVKLLRAIQDKKVRPVGDTREFPTDVRIISASNRIIGDADETGVLRKDLFYRLNVVSIKMPPLRERKRDIPDLVSYFLDKYGFRTKKGIANIEPGAMDALLDYPWPGNVRELENAVERALAIGNGNTITLSDLPPEIADGRKVGEENPRTYNLRDNEIALIKKALSEAGGNKADAAGLLGIDTSTLYRKIKKYSI